MGITVYSLLWVMQDFDHQQYQPFSRKPSIPVVASVAPYAQTLVSEWIHFTLFGIVLPTMKLKVYTFGGL